MGFHVILVYIFFIAIQNTCLGTENTTICSEQERLALLKFKKSVKDEFGMLSSWVGNECCRWEGVRCDVVGRTVVGLCLRGNNQEYYDDPGPLWADLDREDFVDEHFYLVGDVVESSLAELRHLKYLDLSGNKFKGSRIPHFIGSFKQLIYLNLSCGDFHGMVPHNIGNLSKLEVLVLTSWGYPYPRLEVDDITWVLSLQSLKHLDLSGVDLSRVQNWDKVLCMIHSLTELSLSRCMLYSANQLSPSLNTTREFSSIQHLDLSSNSFDGAFPSLLTNMSSLKVLDLYDNNLNSSIPFMPNLLKLDISWNKFKHIEHVGVWRQCHLKQLRVSSNLLGEEMMKPSTNISTCSQYALEVLYLDLNELNGSIPESLGRLANLRVLDLSKNNLTGSIPEALGRLRSLQVLDLSLNQLNGPIPTSIGRLTSLQVFSVNSNLLNGEIPVSIGQLEKLKFLDFSSSYFEGVFTEAHFASLSMLEYLEISSNSILKFNVSRDWIPPFQLKALKLGSCKIENGFPQWLRTQRNLKMLVLSNASISGPLPTWFRKIPIIQDLDMSHNKLFGSLANLPLGNYLPFKGSQDKHMGSLLLRNNLFNGSIPMSLCRRTDLKFLDLAVNKLTGKIPKCVRNLEKLFGMILGSNRLSGVIPSSIGHISSLAWLHLNDNNFDGELPQGLRTLYGLNVLDLSNNKFTGKIPEWIIEFIDLNALRLHNNNFNGSVPRCLCTHSCLQILDLAHNRLKGPIPPCFGEMSGMVEEQNHCGRYMYEGENMVQALNGVARQYTTTLPLVVNMDLSSNELDGPIPEMKLTKLLGLNLSHNRLSGSIPNNIGNMKALLSLDLSGNKLTGMIPLSMASLTFLSHLNLSHNNLSGRIPTGHQLQTFTDPSIYSYNEYLCGDPLPKSCSNLTTTPRKNKFEAANEPEKVWFYLDIMGGFITGFWGIIGVLLFKKRWRRNLFSFAETTVNKIHVAVAIRLAIVKRRREDN